MSDGYDEDRTEQESTLVTIGDGNRVSMQVVQDIYSELTGKKEKLARSLSINHQTTFEDINQLNTKIIQLYEQFSIVSSQCSVTLYRLNDQKEVFSSFERFQMYDSSSSTPSENINIEYHFLVVLPQTKATQSYKILINLHSRAALRKRAQNEHGIPRKFFRILGGPTGNIEIEYVDYAVARTFMTAIQEWADALESEGGSKTIQVLQNYSEHFPFAFRVLTTLIVMLILLNNAAIIVSQGSSIAALFVAGVVAFGGTYLLAQIAFKAGQIAEQYVDEYQPSSALLLTRGDERVVSDLRRSNRSTVLKSVGALVVAFGINLLAAWVANQFGVSG